jgi:hypothetical protein
VPVGLAVISASAVRLRVNAEVYRYDCCTAAGPEALGKITRNQSSDSSGVSHPVPGCDVLNCSVADVTVSHGAVNRLSSLPDGIIARSTAQSAVRMS